MGEKEEIKVRNDERKHTVGFNTETGYSDPRLFQVDQRTKRRLDIERRADSLSPKANEYLMTHSEATGPSKRLFKGTIKGRKKN